MALRVGTLKSMRAGLCRFTPAGRQAQLHTARRMPQAGAPRTAGALATAVALGSAAYALGSAPVHADTGSKRPSIFDRVKQKGGPMNYVFGGAEEKRDHPTLEEGFLSRHDPPGDMVDDIKDYVQQHPGGAVKLSSEHSVPLPLDGTEQPASGSGGSKQIETVQSGTPRAGATAQKLASTAEGTAESSAEKGKRIASEGEETVKETVKEGEEAIKETAKEGKEAVEEAGEESGDLFLSRHDPPEEMVDDIEDYVKRHPGGAVTLSSEHSVPVRPHGEQSTSGSGGSKQIETVRSGAPGIQDALKKTSQKGKQASENLFSRREPGKDEAPPSMEQTAEEAENEESAYNEDTGEINWDCPCLGGMAHGPCGEEFKQAFSCFVYSEQEPKGIDCVDKFKQMQDCFRKHPDVYADEIAADEAADAEQAE